MRSTVDLNELLNSELRKKAREMGLSFKEALNRVVAAGLRSLDAPAASAGRSFTVKAKECGFRAGIDLLHLNRVAAELDDEEQICLK